AAEHDNGWKEWEDTPRLNPQTLRPHSYSDIPVDQHLEIYRRGIERTARRDRYAGLMVSLHGSLLYSRYRSGQPGAAQFLAEQEARRLEAGPSPMKTPCAGREAQAASTAWR
nr:DUF3891 family protein [Gemmatimonadales bacterium]NIN49152.1 DUF3891 family protein [Gemmatimonadales bacterium]NIP06616.1 DUF3891 family protein [Gemmatimonadales bacterium]NIS66348.1 DUF3891 family protein [Gemmatimonadales bacterium]